MSTEKCGNCNRKIGNGKKELPGVVIDNFMVHITDKKMPQLTGAPAVARIRICIECATAIANAVSSAAYQDRLLRGSTKIN